MTFQWPELLWLLLALPGLVAGYVALLRRRKKAALRYANLELVKEAMAGKTAWRRHLPPVLLLSSVCVLTIAIARPAAVVTVPSMNETIILAMDVSGSMRAKDVEPNRITAAQAAARAFISELPPSTRLGIVSFAATASVVQPPTHSREDALAAIERFQLQKGTASGSAILVSLQTLFPGIEFDLRSSNPRRPAAREGARAGGAQKGAKGSDEAKDARSPDAGKAAAKAVEPGSYANAAIVLLTDGQSNTGPDPIEAARMAAERGVRVFTVGIGTAKGETLSSEGWSMRVRLDEESLKSIADITRAQYYQAGTAADLKKVYDTLRAKLVFERRETEVSALFVAAGAVLALMAAGLSVFWFGRAL